MVCEVLDCLRENGLPIAIWYKDSSNKAAPAVMLVHEIEKLFLKKYRRLEVPLATWAERMKQARRRWKPNPP